MVVKGASVWRGEPHVLVTGTSGAIGSAIAREIRARAPRAKLTLVDVAVERSERLAEELSADGTSARVVACDLAKPDAIPAALRDATDHYGPIEGLVNCAGFMEVRRFESLEWARAEALLMVDLVSPLRLMHATIAGMLDARKGFVVNVASMAGKVTLRGCAFYCAAKAGIAAASEVARRELGPRGVRVVTVYPGPVRSELETKARDQYGRGFLSRVLPAGDPRALARLTMDAVEHDRPRVIYPPLYSIGALPFAGSLSLAFGPSATG
jgi:short-subunit dehydrogenase